MKKLMKKIVSVMMASFLLFGGLMTCDIHAKAANVIRVGRDAKTISAAIDQAKKGDIIEIPKGVYKEMVSVDKAGITLKGENGAVLDGSSMKPTSSNSTMLYICTSDVTVDNIEITGLKLTKSSGSITPIGIEVDEGSKNITISNCKIHDLGCAYDYKNKSQKKYNAHGILISGSVSKGISNVTIKDCELYNLNLGNSEALVLNGNVSGFVVSGNYIHNCDNIGIDAIGYEKSTSSEKDRARDGKIFGNIVTDISSDPAVNITYDSKCAGGIYVDGGKEIDIYDNYVRNCDIGIEVASEHKNKVTEKINVYNNTLAENNAWGGISFGGYDPKKTGYAKNCTFINNTVYNTAATCFIIQYACDSSNKIENNLFIATGSAKGYKECYAEKSMGNTVAGNAATKDLPSRNLPNNTAIQVSNVQISDSNRSIVLDTADDLTGKGSDHTFKKGADQSANQGADQNADQSADQNDQAQEVLPTVTVSASDFYKISASSGEVAKITFQKKDGENWEHVNLKFDNADTDKYSKVVIKLTVSRKGMNLGITNQDENDPVFYRNHWSSKGKVNSTKEQTISIKLTEENQKGLYLYFDATEADQYSGQQTVVIKSVRFE